MDTEKQNRREKKLLAHLFAGIADILNSPGAKESLSTIQSKVTEVICERSFLMQNNMELLSLLENLAAWSVRIIPTHVLKGKLELKAVEMKIGKIQDFINPYLVADEMIAHCAHVKECQSLLPPSPPSSPDRSEEFESANPLGNQSLPLSIPNGNIRSVSRCSSNDDHNDVLTPSSVTFEENFEKLKSSKVAPANPEKSFSSDDLTNDLTRIGIPSNKLPLMTDTVISNIYTLSAEASTIIKVSITDQIGYIEIRGTPKDRILASEEVKRILINLPNEQLLQEKQLFVPHWLDSNKMFNKHYQNVAQREGCIAHKDASITGPRGKMCVVIKSERGWNIRRCKEKMEELINKCTVNTILQKRQPTDRIVYNRDQLLSLRKPFSGGPELPEELRCFTY